MQQIKPTLFCIIISVFLSFSLVAQDYDIAINKTKKLIENLMKETGIPGLNISVRIKKEVYNGAFGLADIDNKEKVTSKTKFRIGSVTKILTAATVMDYHYKTKLNIDKSIFSIIPEFGNLGELITTRQLLTHTSGIRHYSLSEISGNNTNEYPTLVNSLERFNSDTLLFSPGSNVKYSSYGYVLLGAILEKRSGRLFNDVLKKTILKKAGMKYTQPEYEKNQQMEHLAKFYTMGKDKKPALAVSENYSYKWAASGYVSTASDLTNFAGRLIAGKIIPGNTLKEMLTMQKTTKGKTTGYGLGLRLGTDRNNRTVAHHGGEVEGSRTFLILYPEQGISIAIVANLYRAPIYENDAETIAGYFLGDYSYDVTGIKYTKSFLTQFNGAEKKIEINIDGNKATISGFQKIPIESTDVVLEKDSTIRIITATINGTINFWINRENDTENYWGWDKPLEKLILLK